MTDHTWLITGINSGFGRALTEQLLAAGNPVFGTIRKPGSVDDLTERYGDRLRTAILDVRDSPTVRRVVDQAFGELGRIDVVVNNAGYGLFGAAEETTDDQVAASIGTNLIGSIQVVRAALPHLRAQNGGHLVQISSYGGLATNPGASLYHAGKFGIEGFMESTAKDVAPFNIGVTIVEPGGARTDFRFGGANLASPLAAYDGTPAAMARGIQNPAHLSLGDPDRMAARIIEAVTSGEPPRRLVLGSDAYRFIHSALTERLAEVESQQADAASTDIGSAA